MASEIAGEHQVRRRGRSRPPVLAKDRAGNPAYRRLTNPFEPVRLFSEDQVVALHETALALLEDTGLRVLHAGARTRLAAAGAAVEAETNMVRLDRAIVE